ncbi:MAG: hypothetical protein AAF960_17090 [Bacteroidota bacterium]
MAHQPEIKIKKELPKGLIYGSTTAIVFVVFLLPFIAWLLEYKDTISAPLTITTETTPVDIFAKVSGELDLKVADEEVVEANKVLAIIRNSANTADVQLIKEILNQPKGSAMMLGKELCHLKKLTLGNIQPAFVNLVKAVEAHETFLKTDQHRRLVGSKKKQIAAYEKQIDLLQKKSGFLAVDKAYAEKFAQRDSSLLAKEVVSEATFDESNRARLGIEMADLDNAAVINDLSIKIEKLRQEYLTIRSQSQAQRFKLENDIKDALQILENQIATWESTYVLKSDIAGKVYYKTYFNNHKFVTAEEKVFSITPAKKDQYIALLKLPSVGAGKVLADQDVYVKLNNYPFAEYGVLKGKVKDVPLLPFDGYYNVPVHFPNGFLSTYGKKIERQPLMYGIGEVIVERKSLMNRITDQIKSVRYNR